MIIDQYILPKCPTNHLSKIRQVIKNKTIQYFDSVDTVDHFQCNGCPRYDKMFYRSILIEFEEYFDRFFLKFDMTDCQCYKYQPPDDIITFYFSNNSRQFLKWIVNQSEREFKKIKETRGIPRNEKPSVENFSGDPLALPPKTPPELRWEF